MALFFFWVSLGFTRFYWVLPGFTGFYWVLLSFHKILLGFTWFYWVLLGFTGFYWVLLGFTGFYLVLLGFTGFYWVFIRSYWVDVSEGVFIAGFISRFISSFIASCFTCKTIKRDSWWSSIICIAFYGVSRVRFFSTIRHTTEPFVPAADSMMMDRTSSFVVDVRGFVCLFNFGRPFVLGGCQQKTKRIKQKKGTPWLFRVGRTRTDSVGPASIKRKIPYMDW